MKTVTGLQRTLLNDIAKGYVMALDEGRVWATKEEAREHCFPMRTVDALVRKGLLRMVTNETTGNTSFIAV